MLREEDAAAAEALLVAPLTLGEAAAIAALQAAAVAASLARASTATAAAAAARSPRGDTARSNVRAAMDYQLGISAERQPQAPATTTGGTSAPFAPAGGRATFQRLAHFVETRCDSALADAEYDAISGRLRWRAGTGVAPSHADDAVAAAVAHAAARVEMLGVAAVFGGVSPVCSGAQMTAPAVGLVSDGLCLAYLLATHRVDGHETLHRRMGLRLRTLLRADGDSDSLSQRHVAAALPWFVAEAVCSGMPALFGADRAALATPRWLRDVALAVAAPICGVPFISAAAVDAAMSAFFPRRSSGLQGGNTEAATVAWDCAAVPLAAVVACTADATQPSAECAAEVHLRPPPAAIHGAPAREASYSDSSDGSRDGGAIRTRDGACCCNPAWATADADFTGVAPGSVAACRTLATVDEMPVVLASAPPPPETPLATSSTATAAPDAAHGCAAAVAVDVATLDDTGGLQGSPALGRVTRSRRRRAGSPPSMLFLTSLGGEEEEEGWGLAPLPESGRVSADGADAPDTLCRPPLTTTCGTRREDGCPPHAQALLASAPAAPPATSLPDPRAAHAIYPTPELCATPLPWAEDHHCGSAQLPATASAPPLEATRVLASPDSASAKALPPDASWGAVVTGTTRGTRTRPALAAVTTAAGGRAVLRLSLPVPASRVGGSATHQSMAYTVDAARAAVSASTVQRERLAQRLRDVLLHQERAAQAAAVTAVARLSDALDGGREHVACLADAICAARQGRLEPPPRR